MEEAIEVDELEAIEVVEPEEYRPDEPQTYRREEPEKRGSAGKVIAVLFVVFLLLGGMWYLIQQGDQGDTGIRTTDFGDDDDDGDGGDGGDGGSADVQDDSDRFEVEITPENPEAEDTVEIRVRVDVYEDVRPGFHYECILNSDGGGGGSVSSMESDGNGWYSAEVETWSEGSQIWYIINIDDGDRIIWHEGLIDIGDVEYSDHLKFSDIACDTENLRLCNKATFSTVLTHHGIEDWDLDNNGHYARVSPGGSSSSGGGSANEEEISESETEVSKSWTIEGGGLPQGSVVFVRFTCLTEQHKLSTDTLVIVME